MSFALLCQNAPVTRGISLSNSGKRVRVFDGYQSLIVNINISLAFLKCYTGPCLMTLL